MIRLSLCCVHTAYAGRRRQAVVRSPAVSDFVERKRSVGLPTLGSFALTSCLRAAHDRAGRASGHERPAQVSLAAICAGTFGFTPKADFSTGSLPLSVAAGDLNGDSRLDLATANQGSNTVSVLLGNGDGSFAPQVDYPTGSSPVSVALGDLNGDGRLDLATANQGSDTVSVLLNQPAPAGITVSAPAGATAGAPFSVSATVLDGCDAVLTGYSGPVTIAIKAGTGTPGAVLGGTLSVNAVNGVATFSNLTIDRGGGYVLTAGAGTASGDSPPFIVNTPPLATTQTANGTEDTDLLITLTGSDADGDLLSYQITALPGSGTLNQSTAGGTRSAQITSDPATVTDASHRVIFASAANANGSPYASFTFTVNDGTVDSADATVTVNIAAVNDAPSFTPGANQTVMSNAAAQSVAGWASGFTPGPADEAGQTVLEYHVVSNNNPAIFAAAPAIAVNGTLTYTPKAGASGTATIGVVVRDSGGTSNGGVDTSAVHTFTITVRPFYRVFLPIMAQPSTPDLVVSGISLNPNKTSFSAGEPVEITVVVENQGTASAAGFWVDLSINPDHPPTTANQPWNAHCALTPCYGLAWYVPGLAPGARITLTSKALPAGYSIWPGAFAAGTTDLYAYADSYNPGVVAGAVAESNEANNQFHLGGLTATGANPPQSLQSAADLPARPVHLRK
jgi:hypothetical protein